MTKNFANTRIVAATITTLLVHFITYNILTQNNSYVTEASLMSQNIAISFSDIITNKPKSTTFKNKSTKNQEVATKKTQSFKKVNLVVKNQEVATKKTQSFKKVNLVVKNQEVVPNYIPSVTQFQLNGIRIPPEYPKRALLLKQEGVIYLKVLVSDTGVVKKIIFSKKSDYILLNNAALIAVKKWNFKPSIINGKTILAWIVIPIEFKIT
jgi:protein TonB